MLPNTTTKCTTLQYTPHYTATHIKAHHSIGVGTSHPVTHNHLFPKSQIISHKRATKYRSLLRETTYKDKGSYESSPPYILIRYSQVTPHTSVTHNQLCTYICIHTYTHMYTEYARVHIHNTRPAVNVNTLRSCYSVTIYTYMHVYLQTNIHNTRKYIW